MRSCSRRASRDAVRECCVKAYHANGKHSQFDVHRYRLRMSMSVFAWLSERGEPNPAASTFRAGSSRLFALFHRADREAQVQGLQHIGRRGLANVSAHKDRAQVVGCSLVLELRK